MYFSSQHELFETVLIVSRIKIIDDNSFRNCHVVYKYLATGLHLPM